MSKPVLEVRHVNAYYQEQKKRRQILRDITFTLEEGEIVGLVGASGSGKSTLCKCILGFVKDYEGEIIHGTSRPQMIFQDPFGSLNPKKTIGFILEEPLKVQKVRDKERRRQRVIEMLSRVGLSEEYAARYPKELSGGQRQRISIALALITGAKFILADEPLSALDVTVQAQILRLLKEIQQEYGLTYLFVSHDVDIVNMLCTRVLFLQDGKLFAYEDL